MLQALDPPQVRHRDLLRTFDVAPVLDCPFALARAGFKVMGVDADVEALPSRLGEHSDKLLSELGYSNAEIDDLKKAGAV